MSKVAITMATLESNNHIIGDIELGIDLYNSGGIEWMAQESGVYTACVPHKNDPIAASATFTRDRLDIKQHSCQCQSRHDSPAICRHVVAAVLAIQGGIVESNITLGKTASVKTIVTDSQTARVIGSGSLNVFATPMMISLMEQAACKCLEDGLETGQTSVGTHISVSHTAASQIGAEVSVTATIEQVFGRKIIFEVIAIDCCREIGKGKHTRMIVDAERFMENVRKA